MRKCLHFGNILLGGKFSWLLNKFYVLQTARTFLRARYILKTKSSYMQTSLRASNCFMALLDEKYQTGKFSIMQVRSLSQSSISEKQILF